MPPETISTAYFIKPYHEKHQHCSPSNCSLLLASFRNILIYFFYLSYQILQLLRKENKGISCSQNFLHSHRITVAVFAIIELFLSQWYKVSCFALCVCFMFCSCLLNLIIIIIIIIINKRPWRSIGFWDVEDLTFSRQSASRWRWGWRPYSLDALYPKEDSWYSFLLEAEWTPGP
jgi:hypothetical protein